MSTQDKNEHNEVEFSEIPEIGARDPDDQSGSQEEHFQRLAKKV
jgi:hypothetical protein